MPVVTDSFCFVFFLKTPAAVALESEGFDNNNDNNDVVLGLVYDNNVVLGLVNNNFLGFLGLDFADLVERLDNLGNTLCLGFGFGLSTTTTTTTTTWATACLSAPALLTLTMTIQTTYCLLHPDSSES